jgi:hypothetical protein
MIFMSQSGLADSSREEDWDRWYLDHLAIMASVPGISSTQRFKTSTPGEPPSLAMYSVASADVFQDPYYLSVRGMGEWLPLIDRRYYRRNLFSGLDVAPEVSGGQVLLVADRGQPESSVAGCAWTWLECVGIDRSTRYRGITVIDERELPRVADTNAIGIYRAVTPYHGRRE